MICFVLNILFRWDSVQGYRLEQKISHWLILTLWIKVHDGMCQSEQDVIYSALMGTCQCPSPLWFLSFQWIYNLNICSYITKGLCFIIKLIIFIHRNLYRKKKNTRLFYGQYSQHLIAMILLTVKLVYSNIWRFGVFFCLLSLYLTHWVHVPVQFVIIADTNLILSTIY